MILRLVQIALFVPGIVLGIAFDRVDWVAGALVFATFGGVALARYYSRDLAGTGVARLVAAPLAALVGAAAVCALDPGNLRAALPYWLLPVLPALVYALLLALLERGRLVTELRYLRGVLGAAA
jgi:hypothetical protein